MTACCKIFIRERGEGGGSIKKKLNAIVQSMFWSALHDDVVFYLKC